MGSHNLNEIVDLPQHELQPWFRRLKEQCRYEHGTDPYNGTWSTVPGDLRIDTRRTFYQQNQALEYVLANTQKHAPALAVPLQVRSDVPWHKSKAFERAAAKLTAARTAHRTLPEAVLARVRASKSKLKGCGACGSRISTAHIRHMHCPVCHDANFVLTAPDQKRQERLAQKLKEAEADMLKAETEYNKASKKTKKLWVIGGWACS